MLPAGLRTSHRAARKSTEWWTKCQDLAQAAEHVGGGAELDRDDGEIVGPLRGVALLGRSPHKNCKNDLDDQT